MHDLGPSRLARLDFTDATLRLVLDSMPMSVAIVGVNRTYEFGNKYFCDWYGLSQAEIVGMSTRLIFCSDADYEAVGRAAYPIRPWERCGWSTI
jgi:PAS domain-containing protein